MKGTNQNIACQQSIVGVALPWPSQATKLILEITVLSTTLWCLEGYPYITQKFSVSSSAFDIGLN